MYYRDAAISIMQDILGNIEKWDKNLALFKQKCNETGLLESYNEQLFLPDHTVDAAIFCILFKKQLIKKATKCLSKNTEDFYHLCLKKSGGEDLIKPIKRSVKYHRNSRYKRTKALSRAWKEKTGEFLYWYCSNMGIGRTGVMKNLPNVNLNLPQWI